MLEAAIWAWMCDCAAYETRILRTRYGPVELRRGEILISERRLAKDFCMAKTTVHDLLKRLESGVYVPRGRPTLEPLENTSTKEKCKNKSRPMVELITDRCPYHLGTIVKIINYDEYQDISAQRTLNLSQGKKPPRPMGDRSATDHGPQDKTLKESKKDSMVDLAFEDFWKAYPSRSPASNPRKPALEKFRAKVKSGTPAEDIIRGAEGFAAAVEQRRAREGDAFDAVTAVCQAVTFINQERWEQYAGAAEAPLTDEQRAVLARHNGGKRTPQSSNVVNLRVNGEARDAAMEMFTRAAPHRTTETTG